MTFALVALGAGIAVSVELLEALAIVLAVGVSRRWSDALVGAAGAAVVCAALAGRPSGPAPALLGAGLATATVLGAGVWLRRPLARIPETELKWGVGVLLSAFGVFFTAEGLGVAWPAGDAALLYIALVLAT